jgi:hypothetical protein
MSLADCMMELVCHTRWFASRALSFTPAAVQAQYPDEFALARQALLALSKPMSHIELMSEVPPSCITCLAGGAMYLLVAETILGHAPPTMHPFLQKAAEHGAPDPVQCQLLVVRWLTACGLVDLDEIVRLVFSDGEPPEGSEYDSALAVAENLASESPVFVGAHILILRGLLRRHTDEVIGIEDIVAHTRCLVPVNGSPTADDDVDHAFDSDAPEPRTMEDALLLWMRAVIRLAGLSSLADIGQLDDMYLHTNDGRVLSIALNHYRPDLVRVPELHMMNPLTVWQRQDNWSTVIRAAEQMGLWVGVFADEIVAHGFAALNMHILRIVQELFVILAGEAERQFANLSVEIDAQTTFIKVSDAVRSSVVESQQLGPDRFEPVDTSASMAGTWSETGSMLHADDTEDESSVAGTNRSRRTDEGDYSIVLTSMILKGMGIPTTTLSPDEVLGADDAAEAELADASGVTGSEAAVGMGQLEAFTPDEEDDAVVNITSADGDVMASVQSLPRAGESIVMVDMGIMGVAMPIRDAQPPRAANATPPRGDSAEDSVLVADDSVGHAVPPSPLRQPARLPSGATPVKSAVGNSSIIEPRSSNPVVQLFPERQTAPAPAESPAEAEAPAVVPPVAPSPAAGNAASFAPQRSTSPTLTGSRSTRSSAAGRKALALSMAHVKNERRGVAADAAPAAALTRSVVQGSVDAEGVEHLLQELVGLSEPANVPGRAAGEGAAGEDARLKVQNHKLRMALEDQQRRIHDVVGRLRKGIHKQEFAAVMQQVRRHPGIEAAAAAPPATAPAAQEMPAVKSVPQRTVTSAHAPVAAPAVVAAAPTPATAAPVAVAAPADTWDEEELAAAPPASQGSGGVGAAPKPKGAVFNISLGASVGVGKPPALSVAQLQRLKERHDERRKRPTPLASVAPVNLPAINRRNNKGLIQNALRHVCLPGDLNKPQLTMAQQVMDGGDGGGDAAQQHFVVLLKDEYQKQFRGLYLCGQGRTIHRVFGAGPMTIDVGARPPGAACGPSMPSKLFKFDTGSKRFTNLPAESFNQMTDAVTLPPRTRNLKGPPL